MRIRLFTYSRNGIFGSCAVVAGLGLQMMLLAAGCQKEGSDQGITQNQKQPQSPQQSRLIVAKLESMVSDVQSRQSGELIWKAASRGMGLANRDAVKTGAGSSGTVAFTDQSRLQLGEKTLVIIVQHETSEQDGQAIDKGVIALPRGKLASQLKREKNHDVEIVVRTARGWIKASTRGKSGKATEPKFQIELKDDGKMLVESSQGEIQVADQGQEQTIHEHENLVLPPAPGQPAPLLNDDAMTAETFASLPPAAPVKWSAPRAAAKPKVIVHSFKLFEPANGAVVGEPAVKVRGKLEGSVKAFLNGTELTPAHGTEFETAFALQPGTNVLTFQILGPGKEEIRYESIEVIRK